MPEQLQAIAERIAESGANGGYAYKPSSDEIVSAIDVSRIVELVQQNWVLRGVTHLKVCFDPMSDRYKITRTPKPGSRHHAGYDNRTEQLIRRR